MSRADALAALAAALRAVEQNPTREALRCAQDARAALAVTERQAP